MSIFNSTEEFEITAGGGSETITAIDGTSLVVVNSTGTIVLGASYTLSHTGTPVINQLIKVLYRGNTALTTDTATGKSIILLGYTLSNNQAKLDLEIDVYWDGASWDVIVKVDSNVSKTASIESTHIVDSAITSSKITSAAVTLEKQANLSEGNILIGDASNRPTPLNIDTDRSILIGNGTTAVPRAISGDISISNLGVVTIGASKITEAMLAFTLGDIVYVDFEISSAQLLDLFVTPVTVVPAAGLNTLLVPIECWAFLDYNSITYATGGAVHLAIGTVSTGSIPVTGVTSATDLISKFVLTTAVASGSLLNQDLKVYAATANFTLGDSPLKCRLLYKVLSFA